ncbi:hypothetical protein RHS03_06102, partial [Rhizoctonia solani]
MNSFTGTAVDSSSSKFTQTVIPPARSDTGTSYPDYAPPTYEAATSLPAPSITSRSETHSSPDDEPSTESIVNSEPDTKVIQSRDPLDPMPSCFSRDPPTEAAHQALSYPFIVHAKPGKKLLDDAFDTFSSNILEKYNVFDHDWARLIEDIRIAAQLTKGEKATAKVLPVTKYIGCTGYFVSRAIEKKMKRKNAASVNALLEVWNEQFFRPRRLEITLCRGDWRVSSTAECSEIQYPAPDRPHVQPRQRGCCGTRGAEWRASVQMDNKPGESSICGRRKMCNAGMKRQQQEGCSSKKEGYRLVVISI